MNYQHLVYFRKVAELQHLSKAALVLHVTQPALTKAIYALEKELRFPLFKKDGRNIILTHYGEVFYKYIDRGLNEINSGVSTVRHMAECDSKTIFVMALFSMYSVFLPKHINSFKQANPGCSISVEYGYSSQILENVLNGHCNLGICSNFEITGEYSSLEKAHLYNEPIYFFAKADHPLAGKKIFLKELRDENFVVYRRSRVGVSKMLMDLCDKAGFRPRIMAEGLNDLGMLNLVASGEGIALMPQPIYLQQTEEVVPLDILDCRNLTRNINVIWSKDANFTPYMKKFRDMLINQNSA